MKDLSPELHQARAANDQDYNSDWSAEVPDDWSHTLLVSLEQPVVNSRYNEKGEELFSSVDQQLRNETDCQPDKSQNRNESLSISNAVNAKAA